MAWNGWYWKKTNFEEYEQKELSNFFCSFNLYKNDWTLLCIFLHLEHSKTFSPLSGHVSLFLTASHFYIFSSYECTSMYTESLAIYRQKQIYLSGCPCLYLHLAWYNLSIYLFINICVCYWFVLKSVCYIEYFGMLKLRWLIWRH